ncbi:FG-GAP-like repeat-containing protein [Tunturiibacter gelidoferens]|uniref:Tetratricopeptide (TPR) repeat protein n=1 Tax=Tunturiibacter gelidiferens TaxID=3069689 RepID=A0A9X0U337_9BACT|nr:FG-GAP-like repeat-containing protein [Edaphobacter lichenicola]MBB5327939.1 tetratricopeptide (TPR) repeat protein [Edaphobacter lichenicola]
MTKDTHPPSNRPDPDSSTWFSRRSFLRSGGILLALRAAKLRAAPLLPPSPISLRCLATSRTLYPPLLERFLAKLDPAADIFVCEQYAVGIIEVLDSWVASICAERPVTGAIRSHLAESLTACSMAQFQAVPLRNSGALYVERRSFQTSQGSSPEKFLAGLTTYLAPYAKVETLELDLCGIRIATTSPLIIDTDIRYNLVGKTHDGAREQRVGAWKLAWAREDTAKWNVTHWGADPELRSRLIGPGFNEITSRCLTQGNQLSLGIDAWRTALDGATGIDVYGNHGIAVGDIDASGYDSFYVCQPAGLPNRLYRNRHDGTLEDITDASGTGILDGTASALFADFQNRGRQDLLVVRTGGVLLFENVDNGRFEPRPDAFHFARLPQGTFTSAAIVDYNRDGLLDVYLCTYSYYKGLNHHQFPAPYYDAENGPPNFLFRNLGDGTFEDVTVSSGMDQNNNRFSFAAAWCDCGNNGWPDLYVANDFGRKNLYHNNGDGTFTDIATKAGVEDYGPGMSVCWIDHDNDGLQDLYVANMWLAEGNRITADDQFLPGVNPAIRALYRKHNAGNSLYRNNGDGSFADQTVHAGSAKCGWSWSCASWDFDNDGWADLYVANGFVSSPDHYDLQSFFWRQVAQRSATSAGASPEYELAWNAINELLRSGYSWSGYQRNVFFANNRDGTFSEVSGAVGLDLIDDARAFSLSDFDHDGRLEFVLKNRTGPQLRLFRNDLEDIGNSIVLRLTGHTSNRDAIGATVTIESGAQRQTKFISAGSGFASQHTKELSFGLGSASGPISISIRWPTGNVERYDGLPINHRIQIDEGTPTFKAELYRPIPSRTASTPPPSQLSAQVDTRLATWLIAPLFGPPLKLPDTTGEIHQLSDLKGTKVLLTFLGADCTANQDSWRQLEQLTQNSAAFVTANLALFVVSASFNEQRSAYVTSTLPIHVATEKELGPWNIQYRYLFDRRRDMPLPVSFLLDMQGAIVRVYNGLVAAQEVITDASSAPRTPNEFLAHAVPFPGPYYGAPMQHDYLAFGIAFSGYGHDQAAQSAFLRAIDADPNNQLAWFNVGTTYLNRKLYTEARKYLTEATRLNPQDSDAWNNLGTVSGSEQRYDEALGDFRHAALANPHHANAIENMMRIYQFQNRAAEAQKTLEELIATAPGVAQLHLDLSITLVAQNDLKRAREELETSIRLDPSNPDATNNLGAVLLRLGMTDEALEQFERCRRLVPDFDRAAINAASLYNRRGQRDRSREILTAFLARHPDNAAVKSALERMGTP